MGNLAVRFPNRRLLWNGEKNAGHQRRGRQRLRPPPVPPRLEPVGRSSSCDVRQRSTVSSRHWSGSTSPRSAGSRADRRTRRPSAKYLVAHREEARPRGRAGRGGNVLVRKPASPGREKAPGVCLQGHMDMVCEKNKDTVHDFLKDPIELVREDNFMTANGTTLGADNGIAVATCLAIMEDKALEHGPLEFLFTVDEETGLTGANNLQPGFLAEHDPAEPRFRGRGRAVRRLLRRPRQHRHLDGRVRRRAGGRHGPAGHGQGPEGRALGPRDPHGPRQRAQDPDARPARPRRRWARAWRRSRAATSETPSRARRRRSSALPEGQGGRGRARSSRR